MTEQDRKTTEPIKASDVKLDPEALGKTPEQIRKEKAAAAVRRRSARREALRGVGALDGSSSDDLASRLEARVAAIGARSAKSFKARRAVEAMKKQRDGGQPR